ncbi:MAG: hypothetical protein HFF78_00260, partial [Oscillospiraceae bacterium]|nr:hypothetical protein [Oscillospiraceae bacterium]
MEELLSDLDMGFAPATFITLAFSNLFQLLFFTCPEKTSRRRRYTENGHSIIRPYSATSNCQKHKQLRQKYGTIGAREKAKTM